MKAMLRAIESFARERPHLLIPAAILFLVEIVSSLTPGYEYFIDELYYVACAKRLALGYVDHPPLAPILLMLSGTVTGYSVTALRIVPALAGAAVVVLSGLMAAEMGGKRTAQTLAAMTTVAAPLLLSLFSFYSVNALEVLFWAAALYVLVRLVNTHNPRLWIAFGVISGLALLTKHTYVLLGGATVIALAWSKERRQLVSRHFWLGVLVAALIVSPNLLWQLQNGFPSLEFYRNAMLYKNIPTPPFDVVAGQIIAMNPLALVIWAPGVWFLLMDGKGKQYRLLGLVFVLLFAVLIISQSSRPDRVSGIYLPAIAGGCIIIERFTEHGRRWIRTALSGGLVAATLALAPLAIPVLSPEAATRYASFTGLIQPMERGEGKATVLPQLLADRIGWDFFAREMAAVFEALPPEERVQASLFVPDYGHAGILELRRKELGLPEIFCPHNTYWIWGKDQTMKPTLVAVTFNPRDLERAFRDVRHVTQIRTPFAMPWRSDIGVFVAREPFVDLGKAWEQTKHFE